MVAITRELRSRLLGAFNGRRVPYPQDRTILRLFEDRALQRLQFRPGLEAQLA